MPRYDESFYAVTRQSRESAGAVIDFLHTWRQPTSVADFGCAMGTWLATWQSKGVAEIYGVDGAYGRDMPREIPADCFLEADLSQPINLGRHFDLVQSLEVAEHLPGSAAATFVQTLARHGDVVLFSAAPPGQGGEHHVNEQPYSYWRDLFAQEGFDLYDCLRPAMKDREDVRYWYRYNCLLFARPSAGETFPEQWQAQKVRPGTPVPDISPMSFKLRKQLVRCIPPRMQGVISAGLSRLRASTS